MSYKVDGEIRSMDESMKLTPTETSYFIDEIYSFCQTVEGVLSAAGR